MKLIEKKNTLFPIFLKLENLFILIIGGGKIALEKLNVIYKNSPKTKIYIVSNKINSKIIKMIQFFNLKCIKRFYKKSDFKKKNIIIIAINNYYLNRKIKYNAKKKGKIINVVDTPKFCDFYFGSIVQKGNLKIAISTNGKSPTIAKHIKETFLNFFPNDINKILLNIYKIRSFLKGDLKYKIKIINDITKKWKI